MQHSRKFRLVTLTCLVLLLAAVVGLAVLYPRATRTLVQPHQQSLVDRAVKRAAATFRHSTDDQRRITFPIVIELRDRTCVELRSTASDRGGNYLVCYSRSGEMTEEQAIAGF